MPVIYNVSDRKFIFPATGKDSVRVEIGALNFDNMDSCKLDLNEKQFQDLKKRPFFKNLLEIGQLTTQSPKKLKPFEQKLKEPPQDLRPANIIMQNAGTIDLNNPTGNQGGSSNDDDDDELDDKKFNKKNGKKNK